MKDGLDRGDACDVSVEEVERGKSPARCPKERIVPYAKCPDEGEIGNAESPSSCRQMSENWRGCRYGTSRPGNAKLNQSPNSLLERTEETWAGMRRHNLHYWLRKGPVVHGTEHDAKDPECRYNKSFQPCRNGTSPDQLLVPSG